MVLDFAKEAIKNSKTEVEKYLETRKKLRKYNYIPNQGEEITWVFTNKENIDWSKLRELMKFDHPSQVTF
jgi:hypothetical protein